MKKSLLLTLVSLLVFNAVAWGEYKTTIATSEVQVNGGGGTKTESLGGTAKLSKVEVQVKTANTSRTKSFDIGTTNGGNDIFDSKPTSTNFYKVGKDWGGKTKNVSAIYFKNNTSINGKDYRRFYKDITLHVVQEDLDVPNATVGSYSTNTFNVYANSTPAISDFTSSEPCFSVSNVAKVSGYCYCVTITFKPTSVKSYSGNIGFKEGIAAIVSSSGTLPTPTNLGVVMDYTSASLNWSAVSGAEKYIITYGDSTKTTPDTNIVCDGLHLGTQYTFSVKAFANNTTSATTEINGKTKDLNASASFTVSNASYSTVDAQWAAIPNATGYYIVSNDGVVNIFDGGTTTSGTLVGLQPNKKYKFTIYGMYDDEVSKNGTTSTEIGTSTTKCDPQNVSDFTLKDCTGGGLDYNEAEKLISTDLNEPKISFSFAAKDLSKIFPATGYKFTVYESADNKTWTTSKFATEEGKVKSGTANVQLNRNTRYIKVAYKGNFCAQFSNINIYQGSYLEVPETTVDFGNVAIGENPTKDIVVNYSTMVGNVSVSKEISDKFSTDKNQVGKDDCGYGSENITVTFDGSEQGAYEGTITIGSVNVAVKATVTLPVPTLTASEITYNSAKLSWNAVEGAEKYKLNFIGGNSIETTDTWSVCDTLKLHSSNQFTVQAYGGGQYTDPSNVVTVNTLDLAAPQNFTTEEVSYTSIPTVWDAVKDATGYRIQNETLYTYEDVNAETTAYLFAALNANTEYTISVTPIYNGELSNNKASLIVKTKETPYIPVSDCEQFRDVSEKSMEAFLIGKSTDYNFGKAIYKSNVSFKAKASNGALLNTDLYAQVNGQWQKIWDESDAGITSSYKTFTATVPDGATAVRFYNNTGSSMWRNYSELIVKKRNELTPSTELLKFGNVLIGTTDTKTITLEYSNLSDMTILSEGGSAFKIEMPKTLACESGTIECKISYSPVTLDQTQQGTISLYNGLTKGIAIEGGVKPLPATNAAAAATGKSAISVQWDKVSGATGYKLTCAAASINVTIPDTGSEHYSYNATGLDENTQYTFTITTMYNAIENESASASATTYSTVKVEKAGAFAETTTFTLSGVEGQWNKDENSFASGSTATINASNSNVCAKFDKLTIGETKYTTLPQAFIVNAPATATIYYTAKELDAPVVTVNCGSKNSAELSWSAVECADSYTVYVNGVEAETGITATSYTATDLTPATDYTFVVKAVSGSLETASESATATTYGIIKVQVGGDATSTTSWTLTGVAGKWNETEESFEVGSDVSVLASNSDAGVIFDKIQYYGGESTINPTSITVLNASVAETWVGIYYKYNGVAKTDDGQVFPTLNDAVEYSKTHEVSEVTLLTDRPTENLDLTSGSKLILNGNGFKIGDVTIESGAKLTTSGALIMGNLNIKTEYRNSGEVDPNGQNLDVMGTVSFDKVLDPSGKVNSKMYYGFSVPFSVNVDKMYAVKGDGSKVKLEYTENYYVYEYNGTKRAATGKGWVQLPANAELIPGKMYLMASRYDNVIRFYKSEGAPIVSDATQLTLEEFPATDDRNKGWNALGNSQIFHVDVSSDTQYAQVLKNGSLSYDVVCLSDESFAVAAPLFIQYASGSKEVNLSMKSHSSLRSASVENETFNLRITGSNSAENADQLFLTASEYASADYVIGRDLAKMGDLTGVSEARIWMKAKSANLCVMDAKLINGVAVIPLGIYVPKAGNYDFYLNSFADGVKLELLYNGEIIHNFADGSFSTALAKGSSDSYSLKVSVDADAPVITDADEVDGVEAYIVENILYIKGLNSGAEYTVLTLQNRIANGVADGGIEQIALPAQGVYIIVSGETTIKLLND